MRENARYAERARGSQGSRRSRDGARGARDVLEGGRRGPLAAATAHGDGDSIPHSTSPGSADHHDGNLNCPLAVTRSALHFAFACAGRPGTCPCAGAYRP